jgi:fructokinase
VSYVVCVGEALIDFVAQSKVPDIGASEFFRRAPGGAVANVSVGIARLGGNVRFVASISDDSFGNFLKRTLMHEQVNIDNVRTVNDATTLAFVARGERGARDFFFIRTPGADSRLEAADITAQTLAGARVVHFGGVLLSSEPARSACFEAARSARQSGALVSFDPNVRESLWESFAVMRRVLLAGIQSTTLLKLSEDDARALGIEPSDVSKLLNQTTRAVVLTRAERGAAFVTLGTDLQEVPAPDIDPIDTTGAGDAFMAALLWRLERYGYELTPAALADAVRYGCAAGAVACLTEGAIPSLPTVAALEAMMARLPHSS